MYFIYILLKNILFCYHSFQKNLKNLFPLNCDYMAQPYILSMLMLIVFFIFCIFFVVLIFGFWKSKFILHECCNSDIYLQVFTFCVGIFGVVCYYRRGRFWFLERGYMHAFRIIFAGYKHLLSSCFA